MCFVCCCWLTIVRVCVWVCVCIEENLHYTVNIYIFISLIFICCCLWFGLRYLMLSLYFLFFIYAICWLMYFTRTLPLHIEFWMNVFFVLLLLLFGGGWNNESIVYIYICIKYPYVCLMLDRIITNVGFVVYMLQHLLRCEHVLFICCLFSVWSRLTHT